MNLSLRLTVMGVALTALLGGAATASRATSIDGPWANAVGVGDGPISEVSPGTVTVGDGTADSAVGEMIHAAFPTVTLAATDDFITLFGTVSLTGTGNFPATGGSPRTQFRFGLFNGDSSPPNDNGWVGYSMSNRHGNASTSNLGTLARKPVGNTSAYLSTSGQNVLNSVAGDGTEESLFWDGTYEFSLTIQRDAQGRLDIFAYLAGLTENQPDGYYSQILFANDATAATAGTYTFNRVGFLLGGSLSVDEAIFNDLEVSFNPVDDRADFDGDEDVDGNDFLLWQRGVGTPDGMAVRGNGDANRDGYVDFEDLNIWKTQMDAGEEPEEPEEEFVLAASAANVQTIPEPGAAWLAAVTAMGLVGWRLIRILI